MRRFLKGSCQMTTLLSPHGWLSFFIFYVFWWALWVLTETLALIGGPVHEDFGRDDVAKGQKHLHELGVPKLLRQVVDKQVTAFRPCRNRHAEKNRLITWLDKHKRAFKCRSKRFKLFFPHPIPWKPVYVLNDTMADNWKFTIALTFLSQSYVRHHVNY